MFGEGFEEAVEFVLVSFDFAFSNFQSFTEFPRNSLRTLFLFRVSNGDGTYCGGTVSSLSQSHAYGVRCSEMKSRHTFCHFRNSGV